MQKVYQRINWENEPSTKSPINDDNLNKMDYAIDQIDNRVVQLSGYEERVSQSEANAKVSETNAKVSEINAKESELKAKEYMEQAFKGTPEGYQEFLDKVEAIEIKTTKENTIKGTKHGGFRLTKVVANTVQNGTPSPSTPFPLFSTGDCVEMIVGDRNTATGVYQPTWTDWRISKNPIPCKAGDIVNATRVSGETLYCYYFNDTTYLSYGKATELTGLTVPSGANNVYICVPKSTYDRGCKLTINGKYLGCVKTVPKNLINNALETNTKNGVTCTKNGDGTYTLNGTATSSTDFIVGTISIPNGAYKLVGCPSGGGRDSYLVYIKGTNAERTYDEGNGIIVQYDNSSYGNEVSIFVSVGAKLNNVVFKPMLTTDLSATYDDFVLYDGGPTIAWYTTQYPPMKGSTLFKEDGLFKAMHTMKEKICSASSIVHCGTYYGNIEYYAIGKSVDSANYGKWARDSALLSNKFLFDLSGNHGGFDSVGLVNKIIGEADQNNYWLGFPKGTTLEQARSIGDVIVQYTLATPIIETLDTASQIALNSLETFEDVTYVEFDTRVQPLEFEAEVGTSQVGAYTLKALNDNDIDRVERAELKAKYNELAVMIVATGSEV